MVDFGQQIRTWTHRKPRTAALLGYTLVTFLAYFPRSLYLFDFPGVGLPEGDTGQYFWNFWWTLTRLQQGQSLYITNLLFSPEGADLRYHSLHLAGTLFVLPFQALGMPALGYNLVSLVTSLLTGWGMYLLCRDFRISHRGSWVAGALLLLCPFRFGQMIHFTQFNTLAIPFYLLFMRRSLRTPSWKAPILWGFWLFFAMNCSGYYLIFLLVISPLWAFSTLRARGVAQRWRPVTARVLLAGATFCLLSLPQALQISRLPPGPKHERPADVSSYWSADLMNFFIPPFLGKRLAEINPAFFYALEGTGEFAVFPGIGLWLLFLLSLRPGRRGRGRIWLAIALTGAVLALGPVLKVFKLVQFQAGGESHYLALPGRLLQLCPFLGATRTWTRWSLIFQFGLIGFIAANYHRLEFRFAKRWQGRSLWILAVGVVMAVFLETWPGPLPHSNARPPEAVRRMGEESGEAIVLNLPIRGIRQEGRYMYLQTLHHLPMCNGYTSFRATPSSTFVRSLLNVLQRKEPAPNVWREIARQMRQGGIGWIILHGEYHEDPSALVWTRTMLEDRLGATLYGGADKVKIYRLPWQRRAHPLERQPKGQP